MKDTLFEHRCTCGKLLYKGVIAFGTVSVKCRGCGQMDRLYGMGTTPTQNVKEYFSLHEPISSHRILDVSPSHCAILGYTRDELLSMTVLDIDPTVKDGSLHELEPRLEKLHKEQIRNGIVMDTVHRHKNGTLLPVRVYVQLCGPENRPYILSRAVVRSETSLENGTKRAFFTITIAPNGSIVSVSKEIRTILGYEPKLLIGMSFFELHAPEWQEECVAAFTEASSTWSLFNRTPELLHKDGHPIPIELYFKPRDDYFSATLFYEGVCVPVGDV